jgi:hypothetical protein
MSPGISQGATHVDPVFGEAALAAPGEVDGDGVGLAATSCDVVVDDVAAATSLVDCVDASPREVPGFALAIAVPAASVARVMSARASTV